MKFLINAFLLNKNLFSNYSVYNISLYQIMVAIYIILITVILNQLFVKVILKVLKKRTNIFKTDNNLLRAIKLPARLLFLSTGLYFAIRVLSLPFITDDILNRAFRSVVIYSVFWGLYMASNSISLFFEKISQKASKNLDDVFFSFMSKALKAIIVILGIVLIAQQWEFDLGAILAGLGLGGLAFALAAKDTVANLFGGITIMIDKPFSIGDWIVTPQVEGTVEEIGFRSTRVRTFDLSLVSIPNSIMVNESITNRSSMDKRRMRFIIKLAYKISAKQIEECIARIRKMLNEHPEIYPDTINVYFQGFGDSAAEILVNCFTKTTAWQEFMSVQEDVYFKIMKILDELNLSIALPSTSVYIQKSQQE